MPTINIEGRAVNVDDSFLKLSPEDQNATVDEIASSMKLTPSSGTGFGDALLHGASGVVSGIGKTVKDYISPETGRSIEAKGGAIAPSGYKPAGEEFAKTLSPSLIPRGLTEALPGLSADVLAGLAGKALLGRFGGLGGMAASYMARTMGDNAEARAANNGNAEPSTTDKAIGAATSGAGAALNSIGVGRLVNPARVTGTGIRGVAEAAGSAMKTAAATGASGLGSDVVSQAGQTAGTDSGLEIDPRQALASGVMSAAAGTALGTPRLAKDATAAVKMRAANEHPEAASAVANRMVQKAGDTDALGDPRAAFRALSDTQSDIIGELRTAKKGLSLPDEAKNALDRANRKLPMTPEDIAAVEAVGNPQITDLLKQANAVAKLRDSGQYNTASKRFGGGAAEAIRNATSKRLGTVVGTTGAFNVLGAIGNGGVTAGTAAAALPGTLGMLGGGLAAYKVLQKIEKGFGTGAPARTFAEKFADPAVSLRPDAVPLAPKATTGPKATQTAKGAKAPEEAKSAPLFDDYPEAPWALENSPVAARMAMDHSIALGGTIHSPDGYMRSIVRRVEGTEKAFDGLGKAIKGPDQSIVEDALAKMKFVRSPTQAREFREAFKQKLPAHQAVIDKWLNDDWIDSIWTSKKKPK